MGGTYLPKLGYLAIRELEDTPEPDWWCQSIWRLFYPLKIKLFFKLVLDGKIPVWDSLTHRFLVGPTKCNLCEQDTKSIDHLFLSCPYASKVWKSLTYHAGIPHFWNSLDIKLVWKDWISGPHFSTLVALSVFAIWGIWLAWNKKLFDEILISVQIYVDRSFGIFKVFPVPM